MTERSTRLILALAAVSGAAMLSSAALAQVADQETPSQARARAATSSLNGGPADSTLTPRPNAQPPLSSLERPQTATTTPRPPAAPTPAATRPSATAVRTPQATAPASHQTPAQAAPRSTQAQAQAQAGQTRRDTTRPGRAPAAPVMEEPEPISLPLGYYVRGDTGCAQVWPRQGDLAWLTPTAFVIDFGGCEPGQFLQTAPMAWRESQQCHTELGNDAGTYEVTYALTATGTLTRTAHLAIDGSVEEDVWRHCETADVPVEARFKG